MQSSRSGCSSTTTSPSHGIGTSSRHAQLLRQFNEDIFKRHVLTDVEVVIGGNVFKSHRAVLVCFSPALKRKLLTADGKPIARKVYISRISSEEFETLLHYMYTGDLNVTCDNFYEIFKAASVLEMQDVVQECLQILDRPDDIRTYFYIYVTAKKMDAQRNWLRALRLLTHRFEESICDPQFLYLDLNCVMELLSAQSIGARSEVLVFLAALNWLNHDCARRQEPAVKVMGFVRFSSMTMDEIVACYHPPFLPQLLEIPEVVLMLFKATCYITAKFLGQESWFRHFGCPKRNLAFENLPMELWHKKDLPKISSTDSAENWQNSAKSEIPEDNHKSLDSKKEVNIIPHYYKHHEQLSNPANFSNSLQHTKNGFEHPQHPPKNRSSRDVEGSPSTVLGKREESASHLAEAVKKALQQSAQTSRGEINVAEVVKRVLGEINTRRDQREEAEVEENRYRLPQKSPHPLIKGKIKNAEMSHKHDHTSPADMVAKANLPCLSKGSKPRKNHETATPTKEERAKSDTNDNSKLPWFSKGSKLCKNHETTTPAKEEYAKSDTDDNFKLPWFSKGSKPCKNHETETPVKEEYAKSDANENSKGSVGNEKEKEPTFFTAVKEESRLLKDQIGKVLNIRLKYDPPQMKAQIAHLEERPPRHAALTMSKSSLVDIYEAENRSSSVNLSLESSPQRSNRETAAILVTGGMNPNNLHTIGIGGAILNYDPKKENWTRYATLPSPRHNHSAVFWDNCLYIIGGCNPLETLQQKRYVAQRSCYKLDFATSQWSALRDMKFRRYDHCSVVMDGRIYVIGGQDNGERLLKTMEVFVPKTGKWKVLPSEMCCGRKAMGTAVFEGKIWIAGGLMQADKEITLQMVSHVDCYDPKQKRWTFNLVSLPTPRCYCSLAVWNDRIYCIGGLILESRERMRPTREVWIFNDKTQTWEGGPPLPVPRMSCESLVYDGLLYAIGGFDPESDVAIRNVNYLSPAATYWEVASPLPSHLFGIAAVSVPQMD